MLHEFFLRKAANAAYFARTESRHKARQHFLAAVGESRSGVVRSAVNRTSPGAQISPSGHAEIALLRKAKGVKTVYVARANPSGQWAQAKPCPTCEAALRAAGVRRVIYTIGPMEYGVMNL